ncbi:hypothetical protein RchiOBHm_Chr6g0250431 [Rosa chinensis]|uniref:Uncharacterized protein n=1 Tax=Rosa chinensis TaxID=74649 RepID=A0A2P6PKI7_ROSCH|nr:hypothetical protein RchiOBHm_Chr6g0250431 [Rosa chinensis]
MSIRLGLTIIKIVNGLLTLFCQEGILEGSNISTMCLSHVRVLRTLNWFGLFNFYQVYK